MGLANSAISRRMKALEERLGVQLIQRTTRTMHLTDDGQQYYQRCRKLLDDWHEAEQEVMQSATELTGTLTVSAPLSLGLSHLAPAVTDFMLLWPLRCDRRCLYRASVRDDADYCSQDRALRSDHPDD